MIGKADLFAIAKTLEGIPVLGTLDGSPAARAGIRYGDVLLSVNGVRTRTVSDYVEAKARRADGMQIVVFRTGSEQIQELVYDVQPHADPAAILAELVDQRVAAGPPGGEGGGGSAPS